MLYGASADLVDYALGAQVSFFNHAIHEEGRDGHEQRKGAHYQQFQSHGAGQVSKLDSQG